METRKVQQVGGGTYTVSIPISWAEEHGIEAGGTAYLYTHRDGSLVVRWGERETNALSSVEIDLDAGDAATASRALDAAYTAGFDRVVFHAVDDAQRRSIAERARTLVGVDVAAESDSRIEVQWLLDDGGIGVAQSVRQLRFVTGAMYDAAMATFVGATAESGYTTERTDETDRLARLVERQFARAMVLFEALDRLDVPRSRLFAQYRTARELERVATEAGEIARAVERSGPAVSDGLAADIRDAGDDAREVLETAADTVTDGGSTATAHEVLDRAAATVETMRALQRSVESADPPDGVLLTRVLDAVGHTARHAETIGEVALQRAVQP